MRAAGHRFENESSVAIRLGCLMAIQRDYDSFERRRRAAEHARQLRIEKDEALDRTAATKKRRNLRNVRMQADFVHRARNLDRVASDAPSRH